MGDNDNFMTLLYSIFNHVNSLLKDENEKRAHIAEELKLHSEQLAFLEFDYEWDFSRKWR